MPKRTRRTLVYLMSSLCISVAVVNAPAAMRTYSSHSGAPRRITWKSMARITVWCKMQRGGTASLPRHPAT